MKTASPFRLYLHNQFTNQACSMSGLSRNQRFKLSMFSPSSLITQLSSQSLSLPGNSAILFLIYSTPSPLKNKNKKKQPLTKSFSFNAWILTVGLFEKLNSQWPVLVTSSQSTWLDLETVCKLQKLSISFNKQVFFIFITGYETATRRSCFYVGVLWW